ncbi:MAG: alpha/beta hydrolase family protein [Phycisphaerales bacterium]
MIHRTTPGLVAAAAFAILLLLGAVVTPAYGAEREIEFPGGGEGVVLAGTLTLPDGAAGGDGRGGGVPGVVLVTGSGPQDRDETILGKKPFAVLAREFSAAGFAVLRYDDRGFGQSTGRFADATIDDFIADAGAALQALGSQPEVDASSLFVLGHSEGGGVAAELAAAGRVSGGVVYLAGTALPGHAVLTDQSVRLARAAGADEARCERIRAAHAALMQSFIKAEDRREIVEDIIALIEAQTDGGVPVQQMRIMAAQTRMQMETAWMRRFLEHDPAVAAAKSTVPALALFGTLDLQVHPDANAAPMRAALEASGHPESKVVVLEGKNHLFQNAQLGIIQEYGMLDGDLEPEVAALIAEWMRGVLEARGAGEEDGQD